MKELYDMIFKRKSVRKFDETLHVAEELENLKEYLHQLVPIQKDIKTRFKIVKKSETTCKRGEYCLLMYSENKPDYLLNAGYMLEQVDLFLASCDIGVCWYGFGKTDEKSEEGMDFIIMLAFGKIRPQDFRKDITKCSRKALDIIWTGGFEDVARIARYAPSSCNMQPWWVESTDKLIKVYKTTDVKSIMPVSKRPFYNTIDMGIFICFLEIILAHNNYQFNRTLINQNENKKLIEIAEFEIIKSAYL